MTTGRINQVAFLTDVGTAPSEPKLERETISTVVR